MKIKKAVWISYDFGLKGDYTGLFTWLNNHKAVECGSGLAFIKYDVELNVLDSTETLISKLKGELIENVELSKSDRLYVVWHDSQTGKIKGHFIAGSRKQAPWEGFGDNNDISFDIEE